MKRWALLAAVAGLVGAGLLAVVISSSGDGGNQQPSGGVAAGQATGADREAAAGGVPALDSGRSPLYAQESSPVAPGANRDGASADTGLAPAIDRKIVRRATVQITVDDVTSAVQQVEDAARSAGGFVSSSNISVEDLPKPPDARPDEPPPKRQTATVTLRVPAESYDSVLRQIRGIAKEVKAESSDASEVTEEYTDLQARLRNLQSVEEQYLQLLGRAQSIQDILTVQDRLNSVRAEIEQVQGRINLLNDLTDMATITVNLAPPVTPAGEQPAARGWARQAWDDAWALSGDILKVAGTVAITAGVVIIWLGIPLALVLALAWRLMGPRRRPA